MSNIITEAHNFREEGLRQLDLLVLGEDESKRAALIAMVLGETALLVGPPGGGKTTLGANAYRIVDGIAENDIAEVPALADLKPTQMVGGIVSSTKETLSNGEKKTEVTSSTVEPIIGENARFIFLNEINRMNPYALNAAMEVLENGTLTTTAGTAKLKDLEFIISTMNPFEPRSSTFPMSAAVASRHAIGAVMGQNLDAKTRDINISKIASGWRPQPEKIEPITDVSILHGLREEAQELVIPDNVMPRAVNLIRSTVDYLAKNHSIVEADGRIAKQISSIAKTLALLGGQDRVTALELDTAVKYAISARIGALMTGSSVGIVPTAHKSILDLAT